MFRRFSTALLALCCMFACLVQAQEDRDAQIVEQDYRITSLTDRQQAVVNLSARAAELGNAGETVEAARLLNRVGRFQIRMFVPKEAVKTFQQALNLLDKNPDVPTKVESLAGLASSYDYLSRCDLVQ